MTLVLGDGDPTLARGEFTALDSWLSRVWRTLSLSASHCVAGATRTVQAVTLAAMRREHRYGILADACATR